MVASPACPWDASLQLHGTILFLDRWGNRFGLKNYLLLQTRVSFAFKANLIEDSLLKVCLPISFMGAHVSRGEPRQKWHWALSGHTGHFLLLLPQFLRICHKSDQRSSFHKRYIFMQYNYLSQQNKGCTTFIKVQKNARLPVGETMLISKRGGWLLALGALVTRVLWSTLHSLRLLHRKI